MASFDRLDTVHHGSAIGWLGENPGRFLAVSVGATLLLDVVPYGHTLGYPLMLLSTLAHEMGHGVTGLLVGGHFDSFVMDWAGSGVAHVSGSLGRVAQGLVAAGGLVGPAFVAALAFIAARRARSAQLSLMGAGVALLLAEILVVRGLCGMLFVPAVAALCLYTARRAPPYAAQLLLSFLAVQLSLSVYSRGDDLFSPVAHTASGLLPSDVSNMASALFLPYWFWGLTCAAVSLAALAAGLWIFLRPATRAAPRPLR
jgi:hypothetical protein